MSFIASLLVCISLFLPASMFAQTEKSPVRVCSKLEQKRYELFKKDLANHRACVMQEQTKPENQTLSLRMLGDRIGWMCGTVPVYEDPVCE